MVVRVGRSLHWLGYAFGIVLFIFVSISELSHTGGSQKTNADQPVDLLADPVDEPQSQPMTAKELDDILANKNPLLDLPVPEWRKKVTAVDPPMMSTDRIQDTERYGSKIATILETLFAALAAMALGRALRYILANE